jgi:protein-S-isoprenylcysteine O-methyltransferase Ste14
VAIASHKHSTTLASINIASVRSTVENIVPSMTAQVHKIGIVSYTVPTLGQVIYPETCVRVRWPWLTHAVAVVLLIVIFFAVMTFETSRDLHQISWLEALAACIAVSWSWAGSSRVWKLVQMDDMEQDA